MSLLDDLTKFQDPETANCRVREIANRLSEEEQKALFAAIDDIRQDDAPGGRGRVFSSTKLAKVLTSHGHVVSASSIKRHVKGECSCVKSV